MSPTTRLPPLFACLPWKNEVRHLGFQNQKDSEFQQLDFVKQPAQARLRHLSLSAATETNLRGREERQVRFRGTK